MAAQTSSQRGLARVAGIALIGTSVEWYDFFLYATAAALVFPKSFFPPSLSPHIALLAAFSSFAVGFVARPIGGIVFGHFGDRYGRKHALTVALIMMGVATTLIGVLPTYASIGVLAPVALVLLRFTQGLAIGGQWGGAMLLVTETAPAEKRGLYGSFAQAGAPVGLLLANMAYLVVSASVGESAFMEWGWRIPFMFSIVLVFLARYSHMKIEDTPAFRRSTELEKQRTAGARTKSPVLEVLRKHPKEIVLAAGAYYANQVAIYVFSTFVIAYGATKEGLGFSRNDMLTAVLIASLVMTPMIFIAAMASDKYGRRIVFLTGAVLLGFWSFAAFPLIDTGSFLWMTVSLSVGQVLISVIYGPTAALFTELFSTNVRYSGASLGYQFGAVVGGGFAPLIATALLAEFHTTFAVAVYMAAACVVTIVSIGLIRETSGSDLDADNPAAIVETAHGLSTPLSAE